MLFIEEVIREGDKMDAAISHQRQHPSLCLYTLNLIPFSSNVSLPYLLSRLCVWTIVNAEVLVKEKKSTGMGSI